MKTAFNFANMPDKKAKQRNIDLVIPKHINELYNQAFFKHKVGKNTLIGYEEQLKMLDANMYNPGKPNSILIGEAGIGKTALVEQFIYNRSLSDMPIVVVGLNVERLGELEDRIVVSRMRTLLSTMEEIRMATAKENTIPASSFQMVLFIDEIHKLAYYGKTADGSGSGAMNALKEETGRGVFPLIGATTEYEFDKHLAVDDAFSRRFNKIKMFEPTREENVAILKRYIQSLTKEGLFVPVISDQTLLNLVDYSNAYIWNQANPSKSIMILDKAISLCTRDHTQNSENGTIVDEDILKKTFYSEGVKIDTRRNNVQLIIPPKLNEKYNFALKQLENGKNTLLGYEDKLSELGAALKKEQHPSALLVGSPGIGKTALIEQYGYNMSLTDTPIAIISLEIETLGELGRDVMVARLRSILDDLSYIKDTTKQANPNKNFEMVLFVDEVHKLNNYGVIKDGRGSSGAMNALKESLSRGKFPFIGATTQYEYMTNIAPDPAFDRRLGKIVLTEPSEEDVVKILKRQLHDESLPKATDAILKEIVMYSNAYIINQSDPAKSLEMLDKCIGFCREEQDDNMDITHDIVMKAFLSEDYEIDTMVSPKYVYDILAKEIVGQPLALKMLTDTINNSILSKRNYKRPLMTAFLVGTTGVGKTQTAKALAKAFFGRSDALLVLNGGDYVTADSAIEAQHLIGDSVAVNKRQIILIDEIEKSHKSVLDTYMRIIDDGIARDSHNIERSVNSTIVIATSNLGSKIFSGFANDLNLHRQIDPNKLTIDMETTWFRTEMTVRKALQDGDKGMDNGIRPEFLERFSLLIPYFPLAKSAIAIIARHQLEKFQRDMKNNMYPINIALPRVKNYDFWKRQMSSDRTPYNNIDTLSVMIAQDIIGSEAETSGARSITRFIESRIKTKVLNILACRLDNQLPINGQFKIDIINASFQTNSGDRPDVVVKYVPLEEI
ncbi:AAA family ATPase [Ligilactobacillus murinus]|uniref:AAA family ATPase n=1 Tax=Ligilactobacillus murinus TaxID=1622 RepID=UPI0013B771D8|nr:AAA family ATPase [Ligilactobacillus murinus]NEF82744.1 AAA family ATPase [Ligilactobacillus murinus]NEF84308.1 AAA family ATPase [Ligilactobacillus murinus]NEF87302.1 AAA family ATPase [Ligilactobacillus murinus]NEF89636.1 AAA family ATPase [Ligilactobacillus murinus]NEF91888.1 AAA family ATPase [Ligilactobacillus murinus]